jgi:hypothetical protein
VVTVAGFGMLPPTIAAQSVEQTIDTAEAIPWTTKSGAATIEVWYWADLPEKAKAFARLLGYEQES